jgi:asparagine synthase (glutamine-hydrolysing)
MLRASRALPRAVYGKNFLRNVALEGDARYVDSLSYFDEDAKQELLSAEIRRELGGRDSSAGYRQLLNVPHSAKHIDRLLYLDSKTYLPGDILTKVDRMSMAHSIEARVPLLDYKLIEFVQTIPASLKLRGRMTKHILKQAVRGLVPDQIIDRPKQGFGVPIAKWLNNELRDMLHDTLTDSRTRQRGYFNQQSVEAILNEHARGRRDNSRHLWGLLTLELWQRTFIDNNLATGGAKSRSQRLASVIMR